MRKTARLCNRLGLAAALLLAGAGAAFANSIAVPNGTGGGQCGAGNPNTSRFAGNCGAVATIVSGDATSTHLQDNSPTGETSFRARLHFNTRQVTMASGDKFRLYGAYSGADPAVAADPGTALVAADISFNGTDQQLTVTSPHDSGTQTVGPINLFTDAPFSAVAGEVSGGWHSLEIEWTRAAGTGHFNVWFDGKVTAGGSNTLDNDGQPTIGNARWGAQYAFVAGAANVGTAGSVLLDDYASQRSGPIGPALPFSDVATSALFWPSIQTAYSAEIIPAAAVGTFNPNGTISRRQMARFVLKGEHGASYVPPAAGCVSGHIPAFNDVTCTDPDGDWIQRFADEGITAGCGGVNPPNYCPEGTINRNEMAVFLIVVRGEGAPPSCPPATFADVPSGSPFCPFVNRIAALGITAGCGGGNYCPTTAVTRNQMSAFMVADFQIPFQCGEPVGHYGGASTACP
jgi:hypothetical protein